MLLLCTCLEDDLLPVPLMRGCLSNRMRSSGVDDHLLRGWWWCLRAAAREGEERYGGVVYALARRVSESVAK